MKLTPLSISQDEYNLILREIENISEQIPIQLKKAKKLNIVDDPIKIEGDDLWEPIPWSARWDEDLEYWSGWVRNNQLQVTCHKKISKRLALRVSSAFPPSVYTRTSEGMWGMEDLNVKNKDAGEFYK
jgi:hypothetical protein